MRDFAAFLSLADAALQSCMGNAGFRRSRAGTWSRRSGDDLNVIWLQKHSSDPSFCVNLGVHYTFLPKAGIEAPLSDEIEHADCEIKLRLTAKPATKDQWWPLSIDAATEVANLTAERGFEIFESYRLAGPIAALEIKDIENGSLGILSSLTKVRACLLLDRIHERLGDRDKCREAATLGVKLAGMAVGPKKALKDILKRGDQSA